MSESAEDEATVEYAIQRRSGRIEAVVSRQVGERLVRNDSSRVLLRRTVTPWESVTPPEASDG